jgi:hypothetical protein
MSEDSWSRDPVVTSMPSTSTVTAETTATGPSPVEPHGPQSASTAMIAVQAATEATMASIGQLERHHGMRLARNVAAGTDAALTATTRASPSQRALVPRLPSLPFQTRRTRR